jgi:hypothetical protein
VQFCGGDGFEINKEAIIIAHKKQWPHHKGAPIKVSAEIGVSGIEGRT